ncbi:ribonucleoside-triphosphate reductase, adenosylcobalamin-dependent [Nocardia sp. IFM 10818]
MTETGKTVYERTYARTLPDGTKEVWGQTAERVVAGNLALVDERYHQPGEREHLIRMISEFKLLPAGRHLWASGVKNAQHLMNCWVSGWYEKPSDHFHFTFMRLMEGGGVGANYSNRHLEHYPEVENELRVHIVCDPGHQDYDEMKAAEVLSEEYTSDWPGAFQIEDSREGWADALVDLIDTHYREGVKNQNRVYDVSRVRPAGARLLTFGGRASGPLPLAKMLHAVAGVMSQQDRQQLDGISAMEIDHAIAKCVVAGGVRRSARMSIMHWDDPQILEFIRSKTGSTPEGEMPHWTTNISVEVDAEFWRHLEGGLTVSAKRRDHALEVLELLAEGALLNGEPGIWDSSLSNEGEPTPILATNPCGEITLQASEPCNLGHVNLAAFVREDGSVDHEDLFLAHVLMTRFLIRATFTQVSDPKSREVLDRNRRIGVGHLGVASYLAMIGVPYSAAPTDRRFRAFLQDWAELVDEAAIAYAHELRIPVPVKKRTVAPTGTVSKLCGVSEGIHPIFSRYFIRRIRFSTVDPDQMEKVQQYREQGYNVVDDIYAANTVVVEIPTQDTLVEQVERIHADPLRPYGEAADVLVESADELTLDQLLAFQRLYQELWADNAVSFTANFSPEKYTAQDIAATIRRYGGKLKGSTIFPEASMPLSPYERITKEQFEQATATQIADGVDEECASGACPIK